MTSNRTKIIAPKNIKSFGITLSKVTPPTLTPTKRVVPTGGVMLPIHKLKISIIPKWTGCIPSALQTGRKIGVKIRQAGVISIKVPTINRIIFIKNRITYLFCVKPRREDETAFGIPVKAITHDIILETPIRKMIIPVILALSKNILAISLNEIVL